MAQVAATSRVAAENDGLGAQIKTWFSMESYATRVKVGGHSREDKKALEQLEKRRKMVDRHSEVGLLWSEENATFKNK